MYKTDKKKQQHKRQEHNTIVASSHSTEPQQEAMWLLHWPPAGQITKYAVTIAVVYDVSSKAVFLWFIFVIVEDLLHSGRMKSWKGLVKLVSSLRRKLLNLE